jgi:hypothetical protein
MAEQRTREAILESLKNAINFKKPEERTADFQRLMLEVALDTRDNVEAVRMEIDNLTVADITEGVKRGIIAAMMSEELKNFDPDAPPAQDLFA